MGKLECVPKDREELSCSVMQKQHGITYEIPTDQLIARSVYYVKLVCFAHRRDESNNVR